jgi:co-chaperonin GroES (HSP10)
MLTGVMKCTQKTKGGVLLPEAAKGKAPEGTVVAVGPGLRTQVWLILGRLVEIDPFICRMYGRITSPSAICNIDHLANAVTKLWCLFQNGEQVAPCVKVGDTVILPEYGGQTMKFDDKV